MTCDRYFELLSARVDRELTREEAEEVELHLVGCAQCRIVWEQMEEAREAFAHLEEVPAPEGFAQGVLDRIRAEEKPKVIPLFKRPQVRALAGLAACLVLVAGLYGVSQHQEQDKWMLTTRSFNRDVVEEYADISAQESLSRDGDSPRVNAALADPETEDAPQIAAYAAPETDTSAGTAGIERDSAADSVKDNRQKAVPDMAYAEFVLTLDRMPEGGWELIPPETFVSPVGLTVSVELMEQLEQLALTQGINVSRESGPETNDHCLIIILDETE